MKKLILFISLFLVVNTYGQTITINNFSTSTITCEPIDMDCASNQTLHTGTILNSLTSPAWTFSATSGQWPKVNFQDPFTGNWFAIYTQDPSLCGYWTSSSGFATVSGINYQWTDLGGGAVQIDIW